MDNTTEPRFEISRNRLAICRSPLGDAARPAVSLGMGTSNLALRVLLCSSMALAGLSLSGEVRATPPPLQQKRAQLESSAQSSGPANPDPQQRRERSFLSSPAITVGLASLATSAGIISVTAWWMRERHADRWNSADCLAPERTRESVCAPELRAGESAERIAVGSAIVSGVLFAGAAISFVFGPGAREDRSSVALTGCRVQSMMLGCSGEF